VCSIIELAIHISRVHDGKRAVARWQADERRGHVLRRSGRPHTLLRVIRAERPGDADAIHDLTVAAFDPMPFSDGTEAPIIRALRDAGELTVSLVDEEDGELVGHVAFSPVTIGGADVSWYGLGPISVRPGRQRQGIGRRLVAAGLDELRALGARGCALIGNPAVYGPMGFVGDAALTYRGLGDGLVQRVVLEGEPVHGELRFAEAFEAYA
jgi:putative acetyltransferase